MTDKDLIKPDELKKQIEESVCLVGKINHSVKWKDLKLGNFTSEGNPVIERELLIRLVNLIDVAQILLKEKTGIKKADFSIIDDPLCPRK